MKSLSKLLGEDPEVLGKLAIVGFIVGVLSLGLFLIFSSIEIRPSPSITTPPYSDYGNPGRNPESLGVVGEWGDRLVV